MPSRQVRPESRQIVTDVRVLAALAHPVRIRLLNLLMELGPSTATDCAGTVGVSPSACSYHLRHLERFGLVVRDDADIDDGRTRPWRAVATGYSIAPTPSAHDTVTRTATLAVVGAAVSANADLAADFLAHAMALPVEWQDASEFSSYGLYLTAEELRQLVTAIDALVRPYISATRLEAPDDAAEVHVTLQAFRRIDA